jgi:hypothetical protein
MTAAPSLEALKDGHPQRGIAPENARSEEIEEIDDPQRAYFCAACSHPITREAHVLEVGGKRDHVQMNPHGHVFHFRTFQRAPGAKVVGPGETDWSWFSGTAWHFASCGRCGAHLGWAFSGQGSLFFGLIVQKLVFGED